MTQYHHVFQFFSLWKFYQQARSLILHLTENYLLLFMWETENHKLQLVRNEFSSSVTIPPVSLRKLNQTSSLCFDIFIQGTGLIMVKFCACLNHNSLALNLSASSKPLCLTNSKYLLLHNRWDGLMDGQVLLPALVYEYDTQFKLCLSCPSISASSLPSPQLLGATGTAAHGGFLPSSIVSRHYERHYMPIES